MRKLYENFHIFHFQKKNSFLENYSRKYGNENATLEIISPNCVVLVEEVIVDHPPISCRLIYYLFCPKDYQSNVGPNAHHELE